MKELDNRKPEGKAVLWSYKQTDIGTGYRVNREPGHKLSPPACNGGALLKGWRAAVKDKNWAYVIE